MGIFFSVILSITLVLEVVLARVLDHPVRLARLELGLSQVELARRAGVGRAAVTAVEDGRTRRPSERVLAVLAEGLGCDVDVLVGRCVSWFEGPGVSGLPVRVQNLLLVPPYVLSQYYSSFRQWRLEVSSSVTGFASLVRVNPAVVSRWECGELQRFPEALGRALLRSFGPAGLSVDYLVALEGLPADG